jgi:[CysO sulfur-carrier protein]-S-L-cysteine hydrolase
MTGNTDKTNSVAFLLLNHVAWEGISRHAIETFPDECCGVILHDGMTDKVRRLRNIQNQLHALDPETYPRNAKIAYAMDMIELESVVHEVETTGAKIKAFYHSHPDHEAYFSDEDKTFATPFGEPTFPDSAQIVISIYHGVVRQISAYAWSEEAKDFVEIPIRKV